MNHAKTNTRGESNNIIRDTPTRSRAIMADEHKTSADIDIDPCMQRTLAELFLKSPYGAVSYATLQSYHDFLKWLSSYSETHLLDTRKYVRGESKVVDVYDSIIIEDLRIQTPKGCPYKGPPGRSYMCNVTGNVRQTRTDEAGEHVVATMTIQIGQVPALIGSPADTTMHTPSGQREDSMDGCFMTFGQLRVLLYYPGTFASRPNARLNGKDAYIYVRGPDNRPCVCTLRIDDKSKRIVVEIPAIRSQGTGMGKAHPIPLHILFRALNIESDRDIATMILGEEVNDREMMNLLGFSTSNIGEGDDAVFTKDQARVYLATFVNRQVRIANPDDQDEMDRATLDNLKGILENELLSHVGSQPGEANLYAKAIYLSRMARQLMHVYLKRTDPTDRDSYADVNCVINPGETMKQIFKSGMHRLVKFMQQQFKNNRDAKNPQSCPNVLPSLGRSHIANAYADALTNGVVHRNGVKGKPSSGAAQTIQPTWRLEYLSLLKRISSGDASTGKRHPVDKRMPSGSSVHGICPVETPEGAQVGLTKQLGMSVSVTSDNPEQAAIVRQLLSNHPRDLSIDDETGSRLDRMVIPADEIIGVQEIPISELYLYTPVMLDGALIGWTLNPRRLAELLRHWRRMRALSPDVSIVHDVSKKEVRVWTDKGRLKRPFVRITPDCTPFLPNEAFVEIRNGNIPSWDALLLRYPDGIEYLCTEEVKWTVVAASIDVLCKERMHRRSKPAAPRTRYDHMEIHGSFVFGTVAGSLPGQHHNQAPRVPYATAQIKQGGCATRIPRRMVSSNIDQVYDYMRHPTLRFEMDAQEPIVTTMSARALNLPRPGGRNAQIAIVLGPGNGFGQEDSLVVKKSCGFCTIHTHTLATKCSKNTNTGAEEKLGSQGQSDIAQKRPADTYSKLQANGVPAVGTWIEPGDAVIGKTTHVVTPDEKGRVARDASVISPYRGMVTATYIGKGSSGRLVAEVTMEEEREPVVGDKFCSRHGQKGVVGRVLPQSDMPFTAQGVTPDIIVNPHAFPSRMTIGMLIEALAGKASAISGVPADATSFEEQDYDAIYETLEGAGYKRSGKEIMYCGFTGRRYDAEIFIAPCYYVRLKHQVADKMHACAEGPVNPLTKQPVEGRAKNGGQRLGIMEKDALAAHGVASFLKERMSANATRFHLCDLCGQRAIKLPEKNAYCCKPCGNYHRITPVMLPWALKYFQQQLEGMHIGMRFITDNSVNPDDA